MSYFTKRQLNKAQTRLTILNVAQKLLCEHDFKELKAKDIASQAGVTEMTFFNYFAAKDDLLIYFMQIWTLDIMALQLKHPLKGEAAIRRIFSYTAEAVEDNPRIMLNLICYQASHTECSQTLLIEEADLFLRYPDLPKLQENLNPDLGAILLEHLHEMNPHAPQQRVLTHLFSIFYGDVLIANLTKQRVSDCYRNSLDLIFKEYR